MATTPDDRNVTDYPLDSPKHADNSCAATDVPPITQEELIGSGSVPKEPPAKKPKAAKKELTEEEKKKKEADKKKKLAEKKKKEKLLAASTTAPVDASPRYYYDIQNFIVTNGVDLEQFGIAPLKPSQSGVENTACGKRVTAEPDVQEITNAVSSGQALTTYTYPGKKIVPAQSIFCPDCGLRVNKHRHGRGTFKGEICVVLHCPEEVA